MISTGNELAEPGAPVVPGQIWESNSVMLASAAARQLGCPARRYPIVPDDTDAVLAAIEDAAATADLLVTSGGVSMGGEHDVVKAALQRLGTVRFTKVAMQPGMPQGFGVVGENARADLHAAWKPGQRVSSRPLSGPRLMPCKTWNLNGCRRPCRSHPAGPLPGRQAFLPARDPGCGKRDGHAGPRPGLASACLAGQGERPDRRAGAGVTRWPRVSIADVLELPDEGADRPADSPRRGGGRALMADAAAGEQVTFAARPDGRRVGKT